MKSTRKAEMRGGGGVINSEQGGYMEIQLKHRKEQDGIGELEPGGWVQK